MSNSTTSENPGGALSSEILVSPETVRRDVGLVNRAIREKWPINKAKRRGLVSRLMEIVEKSEVAVPTKDGGVEYADDPADKNSIAAARVLVAMMGQNIAATKPSGPPMPQGNTTVVNVQTNNLGVSSGATDGGGSRLRALIEEFRPRGILVEDSAG